MVSKIIANVRKHRHLTLLSSILIAVVCIDAFEDPKFQLLPKDIGVLVGSTVDFTCSIINAGAINSILDKTIKWCKNGYSVRTGILPGTPSGLHVVNIQPTDEYGCGIDGFLCKETTKLHFVTALSITTSSTTATTTTTTTALHSRVTDDKSISKTPIYHDVVEVVGGALPCSSAVIPSLCTWLFGAVLILTVVFAEWNRLS